jgi:predicted adenylyl cyclase CyaB
MRNLEIKVRLDSVGVRSDTLNFAEHRGLMEQVDTYYLVGERRLKVREARNTSEVIFYVRKLIEGTKDSHYYRIGVSSIFILALKALLKIIFGKKVVVEKKRDLYLYKHTRIHIDTVLGLGNFLELETVCSSDTEYEECMHEHEEVIDLLHLGKYQTIAGSYSDLLLKQ